MSLARTEKNRFHNINSLKIDGDSPAANKYGIQFVTTINVPGELPFEQSDLCRILVNLIDNALEAVLRADNKDFLVSCRIVCRGEQLYICVRNKLREGYDRDALLLMNTEKEDELNHGYGHRIIKRIAEKYNGIVNYTIEDNQFIAEVMLEFGII